MFNKETAESLNKFKLTNLNLKKKRNVVHFI